MRLTEDRLRARTSSLALLFYLTVAMRSVGGFGV
jgi:hypothetical protein